MLWAVLLLLPVAGGLHCFTCTHHRGAKEVTQLSDGDSVAVAVAVAVAVSLLVTWTSRLFSVPQNSCPTSSSSSTSFLANPVKYHYVGRWGRKRMNCHTNYLCIFRFFLSLILQLFYLCVSSFLIFFCITSYFIFV